MIRRAWGSYAPFLAGKCPAWRHRLFHEYEYVRGVRSENLKYVERTSEWPSELYDLEADPGETRNRIDDPAYRRQLEALRKDLHEFYQRPAHRPLKIGKRRPNRS
jgi:arylsulfatase A-like enzyme